MQRIFISYRHADPQVRGYVDGAYAVLTAQYGDGNVFKDVEEIPAGEDFPAYIRSRLRDCDVQLVFISPAWIDARDERGQRKLDDPEDWVRIEVSEGLKQHPRVRVIPVLVAGASPLRRADLPPPLRRLAPLQGFKWPEKGALKSLVAEIERSTAQPPKPSPASEEPWECTELRGQVLALCDQLMKDPSIPVDRQEIEWVQRRLRQPRRARMARRVDALEADTAMRSIERLAGRAARADGLADAVQRLRDKGSMMATIDVAKAYVRSEYGEIDLAEAKRREIEQLLSGRSPAGQLGLPDEAAANGIEEEALSRLRAWKRIENGTATTPPVQRVAADMARYYQHFMGVS